MRAPDFDVLISGAGPAGSHTALRLARRGWRVGLLDARTFPRPKPCGEFLSPACLPLLEELDLLVPLLEASPARVSGMDLASQGHHTRGDYLPLGPFAASHGHGLGIRREVLDLQAVRAAAAQPRVTLRLGWRVRRPLQDGDGRVVGLEVRDPAGTARELRARFVVAADGLRSPIVRALGWRARSRGPDRFAIVARFEGVERLDDAALHVVGRDYFAACPIDGELFTVNLVCDAAALPKGRADLAGFFGERLRRAPRLAARLGGARLHGELLTCGPLRASTRRCTGPGVALVGDAAGFVDPLTGEGLYCAMQGARLLAPALDAALADPSHERRALARYARGRRRELGPRYGLARLLQAGLRRPGVPERVIGTLARVPALCQLLLGLTGDYVPPLGLLVPSVWSSALARGRADAAPSRLVPAGQGRTMGGT